MYDRGDIFVGHTPGPYRAYLGHVLKHAASRYRRLIVPCAGGFSAIQVACTVGWEPERCCASDVSLFSLTLASAINETSLPPITFSHESLVGLDPADPLHVLYAIKLSVTDRSAKHYYQQAGVRDLQLRREHYIAKIATDMETLRKRCGAFAYQQRDLLEHLSEAVQDGEAVVYCNPPGYRGGYDKMYDFGDRIQWQPPDYAAFEPKTGYAKVREIMAGKPALGIRLMYREPAMDETPELIFTDASCARKAGLEYLCSNRPEEITGWTARRVRRVFDKAAPLKAAILSERDEITSDSIVSFQKVPANTALYYRDLFAHRLGTTNAKLCYVMTVNGKITSTVGFRHFGTGFTRDRLPLEVFGFSVGLYRYPRLNRLLMMCITCTEMQGTFPVGIARHARGIRTVCLCKHQDHKPNRSILKLVSRKQLPSGLWRLMFEQEFKPRTFQECLREWLKKHDVKRLATQGQDWKSGPCISTNCTSRPRTRA